MQMFAETTTAKPCPAGYKKLPVWNWGGNNAGYQNGAVFATGTAPSTVTTPTVIKAHAKVANNKWKGVVIRAKSMESTALKARATSTTACPQYQFACSECHCSTTGTKTKPATAAAVACSTTATSKDVGANKMQQTCTWGNLDGTSWLVGLSTEMFGQPCVDPSDNGKATKPTGMTAVFADTFNGCDAFGVNPYAQSMYSDT